MYKLYIVLSPVYTEKHIQAKILDTFNNYQYMHRH